MLSLLFNTLEQTIMFMPLAMSIYLSFQILKVSDLSLDGGFVLGAAVFARCVTDDISTSLAYIFAICIGIASGALLAAIQYRNRISDLLSSIVLSLMLYSLNLNIMERPNLDLSDFQDESGYDKIIYLFCSICFMFYLFRYSKTGLALRAFGDNYFMLNKLGVNAEKYRFYGLMISSGLIAGCGAMTANNYGYCNIDMGIGMALTSLSTVIIGKRVVDIFQVKSVVHNLLLSCFIGSYIYLFILNSLLSLGVSPVNFKIITGAIIIFSLFFAKKPR